MGQELQRLAAAEELPLVPTADEASVVIVSMPSDAVNAPLLESLLRGRSVIDMSGASKRMGTACYGLLTEEGRLLDGSLPRRGLCYGNPGCIAASVLVGLERAGLVGRLGGALHVTAVGSASYAPPGQEGELRLARRLRSHPHVAEIEAARSGLRIASFAPVVSYGTPSGLLTVISGPLADADPAAAPVASSDAAPLDVKDVVGTAKVQHRLEQVEAAFTLAVALDNLTFPAANALALARSLL
jgi:N-acetyl-gamma-glutamylphosphate reductase